MKTKDTSPGAAAKTAKVRERFIFEGIVCSLGSFYRRRISAWVADG
jgi:hypothetical protein